MASFTKDYKSELPYIVLGNKMDEMNRMITKEEAEKWCKENGKIDYFEVSAKTGENVENAFEFAAKKALTMSKYISIGN